MPLFLSIRNYQPTTNNRLQPPPTFSRMLSPTLRLLSLLLLRQPARASLLPSAIHRAPVLDPERPRLELASVPTSTSTITFRFTFTVTSQPQTLWQSKTNEASPGRLSVPSRTPLQHHPSAGVSRRMYARLGQSPSWPNDVLCAPRRLCLTALLSAHRAPITISPWLEAPVSRPSCSLWPPTCCLFLSTASC